MTRIDLGYGLKGLLWKKKPVFIDDPVLAEIIAEGYIHLFPVNGSVAGLERLIVRELGGNASLRLSWETFTRGSRS
jgi:hypothetical protein